MQNLIIEKPSLAPLPTRLGWGVVTAFFWALWVYLWMPLVTLLLWLFGFHLFDESVGQTIQADWQKFGRMAVIYTAVICVMGGGLLAWARIEYMRFRNVNRRTRPAPVSIDEAAEYAGLPSDELARWVQARRIVAYHGVDGRLVGAVVGKNDSSPGSEMARLLQEAAMRAA